MAPAKATELPMLLMIKTLGGGLSWEVWPQPLEPSVSDSSCEATLYVMPLPQATDQRVPFYFNTEACDLKSRIQMNRILLTPFYYRFAWHHGQSKRSLIYALEAFPNTEESKR